MWSSNIPWLTSPSRVIAAPPISLSREHPPDFDIGDGIMSSPSGGCRILVKGFCNNRKKIGPNLCSVMKTHTSSASELPMKP